MNDLLTEFRKIPPVSRTLVASTVIVTLSCITNITSYYKVLYTYDLAFKQLQIWRLYTSFFVASSGITLIFEVVMLYRMMDQLESTPHGPYARRSADLAWQLFVANIAILILSIPMGRGFFFHPFLLCIAYISSSLAPPGAQTSLFGLISFPITYLPYIMLGMDLLNGGPGAVLIALPGAVVGHLWWWGVWGPQIGGAGGVLVQWSGAPRWLKEYMGEANTRTPNMRGPDGGTGANMGPGISVVPPRAQAASSAGASGSGAGGTGYNWGQGGNKLGSG
ncbi:Der1-like family-domain-containing protein [Mycena capillaripes]|nr:Der1-like family-domain-containing protein [Mycena capillaripes]